MSYDLAGLLTIQFLSQPISVPCGQDVVCWTYSLDKPAPCDGYLVQEVRVFTRQDECCKTIPRAPIAPTRVFWEAFAVSNTGTTPAPGSIGQTDCSSPGQGFFFEDSVGTYYVEADVKFYCKNPIPGITFGIGNLEADALWGHGLVTGGGPTQNLQSGNRPIWWSNIPVEGPTQRTRSLEWDCCPIKLAFWPWKASWTP